MQTIWDEVKTTNFPTTIQEVEHPGIHAVYFNMSDTGFDMLIGLMTKK
jgi:hypothetical protein